VTFSLSGKSAIVTGGASNIGRAIVSALSAQECDTMICDLDDESCARVVQECKDLGLKGRAAFMRTDVTNIAEFERALTGTLDLFGKVDILVNNVGWDKMLLFQETDPALWERLIAVNYRSVLVCTKSVLPPMVERKKGRIINIASDAGRVGEPREAVYSGCKAAVIGFSKALAKEVGRYSITVNTVCPGVIIPPENERGRLSLWNEPESAKFSDLRDKIVKAYPLGRLGTAKDVASAVLFLASEEASWITGQTISVSGGYNMI
jgi:2-hydroxycyclohexanecarboxyl-CoA dehydrogenase